MLDAGTILIDSYEESMSSQIRKLNQTDEADIRLAKTEVFSFMSPVYCQYYPGFRNWYFTRMLPSFCQGERTIYVIEDGYGRVVGVSILKKSLKFSRQNNKICSLYILPTARGAGLGRQLIEKSLEEFSGSRRPTVLTIAEERATEKENGHTLVDFFEQHGFRVVDKIMGKYRPGKLEFVLMRTSSS